MENHLRVAWHVYADLLPRTLFFIRYLKFIKIENRGEQSEQFLFTRLGSGFLVLCTSLSI